MRKVKLEFSVEQYFYVWWNEETKCNNFGSNGRMCIRRVSELYQQRSISAKVKHQGMKGFRVEGVKMMIEQWTELREIWEEILFEIIAYSYSTMRPQYSKLVSKDNDKKHMQFKTFDKCTDNGPNYQIKNSSVTR